MVGPDGAGEAGHSEGGDVSQDFLDSSTYHVLIKYSHNHNPISLKALK